MSSNTMENDVMRDAERALAGLSYTLQAVDYASYSFKVYTRCICPECGVLGHL